MGYSLLNDTYLDIFHYSYGRRKLYRYYQLYTSGDHGDIYCMVSKMVSKENSAGKKLEKIRRKQQLAAALLRLPEKAAGSLSPLARFLLQSIWQLPCFSRLVILFYEQLPLGQLLFFYTKMSRVNMTPPISFHSIFKFPLFYILQLCAVLAKSHIQHHH